MDSKCLICDADIELPGYTGATSCRCGAVYQYDECTRITDESLRELAARWRPIPVAERLPERGDLVMAYIVDPLEEVAGWNTGHIGRDGGWEHAWKEGPRCQCYVTHWLPLPNAPVESTWRHI